jgi:hypothetical protein
VLDGGPGPPDRWEAKSNGLGLKLVLWLVKQIDGDLKVVPRANGNRAGVTVIFCSPRFGTDENMAAIDLKTKLAPPDVRD